MQILKFYLKYKIISDFYNFQISYNVDKNNETQQSNLFMLRRQVETKMFHPQVLALNCNARLTVCHLLIFYV